MPASRRPVAAVLAHGAGSTADLVRRALPAAALGATRVIALQDRSGDVAVVAAALGAAVTEQVARGYDVVVGGISLGSHAAAAWLADAPASVSGSDDPDTGRVVGLVAALPAWTGPPDDVAGLTVAAADDVERVGSAGVLARLAGDPDLRGDWVVAELALAWPTYGDDVLVAALRRAGRSPAPDTAALARIGVPALVVGLADDPLHPVTVAQGWAHALPNATLRILSRRRGLPLLDPPSAAPARSDASAT